MDKKGKILFIIDEIQDENGYVNLGDVIKNALRELNIGAKATKKIVEELEREHKIKLVQKNFMSPTLIELL